jgi:predicted ribosomally synthesized peptide with SipW-like signal peptide
MRSRASAADVGAGSRVAVSRPRGLVLTLAAVLGALCIASLTSVRPTLAYFSDSPTAESGTITGHTVAPPASATCSSSVLNATVTWPADTRYDYEVVLRKVSNSTIVSTTQVTGTTSSIQYSGLSAFGVVVGAGQIDFNVEIRSKLATTLSWVSSTVHTYASIRVLAILIGGTVSCTT